MFFFCAIFIYAAVILFNFKYIPLYVPIILLLFLISICVFIFQKYKQNINYLITTSTIGIITGIILSIYSLSLYNIPENKFENNQLINLRGKVLEFSGKSAVVAIEKSLTEPKNIFNIRLSGLNKIKERILKNSIVEFECSFNEYDTINLFTSLEKLRGIYGICYVKKLNVIKDDSYFYETRIKIYDFLNEKLNQMPENSLARGFLLADTESINAAELKLFRKMGIAHLFSASGLHLGLLYGFFYIPFMFIGYKKSGATAGFLASLLFLILLDFRVSLFRAFLFLLFYLLLKAADRKPSPLIILSAAAFFIELVYPRSIFSASFLLSFGVTGVILISFQSIKKLFLFSNKPLKDHTALSFSAFIGSVFLSFWLFDYIHVFSLLYNFLLVPISGIYLASVIISLFIPFIKYIVHFIDTIFHLSAFVHYNIWDRYFPVILNTYVQFWLFIMFLYIVYFTYHASENHYWILRKRKSIFFILLISFFGQFIFINYPQKGVKAFPYAVMHFEENILSIVGQKASFIEDNSLQNFLQIEDFKIKEIRASDNLESEIKAYLLPPYENINTLETVESSKNYIKINKDCFLFFKTKLFKNWDNDEFLSCSNIYLIHSKKYTPDAEKWYGYLSKYSFNGKIHLINYNKWVFY
ncbi:MAG: ComEC/Rec2 family competence protein [Spirochaetia bacterium]|nr:ComEC/Rec2 family competence protein [Spirochaetia bacterium]